MAISKIKSAGITADFDNTLTAADLAPDSVGSSEIAADAVGSSEIAANAVGSSEIAANAVGTSEIATGGVLPANIAYLGDGSGNLSGTLTGEQLRFGTTFTLDDNLTVNGDVTLAKVGEVRTKLITEDGNTLLLEDGNNILAEDDSTGQTLTHTASTARTLTGTGTLRMGSSISSVEGMTGALNCSSIGSAVNLDAATFPTGMVKKVTTKMTNAPSVNTTSTTIVSTGGGTDLITFTEGATLVISVNCRLGLYRTAATHNVRWGSWGIVQHTSIPANGAAAAGTQLIHRAEGRILHETSSGLGDDYSTPSGIAVDTPSGISTYYYLGFFSDSANTTVVLVPNALTWTVMELQQ